MIKSPHDDVDSSNWVFKVPKSIYHVLPIVDIAPHEESLTCWCQPKIQYEDVESGDQVIVHKHSEEL